MLYITKAHPYHLFKLYKFYLSLDRDYQARKYYRYLSTKKMLGKIYVFLSLCLNLLFPHIPRKTHFYIILEGKVIKGVCHITIYKIKIDGKSFTLGIYGIVVDRSIRGKGLGKMLSIYSIRNVIKEYKVDKICLTVDIDNWKAINLYKSLGFKIISKLIRYGYRELDGKFVDSYFMCLNGGKLYGD